MYVTEFSLLAAAYNHDTDMEYTSRYVMKHACALAVQAFDMYWNNYVP